MVTFKARARTLDLLGRQQIAGIPTAISELFKNAHDAYADNVEVDYYKTDKLFVLRDDGYGMTMDEFSNRWLTLGTESKIETQSNLKDFQKYKNKPKRTIMGEKGIGRLAIAAIGPQVLVMTRAKRNDKLHDIIAAFVNWKLFEIPGIDLQDITIPIKIFKDGKIPNKSDIEKLYQEVLSNINHLIENKKISKEKAEEIIRVVKEFEINPDELDKILKKPSLRNSGGVHFFIKPVYETLQMDIDGEENDATKASPLIKMLVGFTNTMTSDKDISNIKTAFRYHETDDDSIDLIDEQEFFTSQEFCSADHHFTGEFDEYGRFKGTVTIYGEKTISHTINWKKGLTQKTMCGPFKINVAYIQGQPSQSKLPPSEHARIKAKCDKLGGLYIYRDGIRILPYGDSDYDFLDIEKRRTLKASWYFFSYRRMFGVIDISKNSNNNLIEKAGREG
ncbi:MAG: ATP-binding protein, partial [Thermoplasmatales archaeon]